jgi:penicillin-binding protein 1A
MTRPVWKSEADYERTAARAACGAKLKEVPYSMAMEAKYSKEEILTIYFNRAYLGAGRAGSRPQPSAISASPPRTSPRRSGDAGRASEGAVDLRPDRQHGTGAGRAECGHRADGRAGLSDRCRGDEARTNPARLSEAAKQKSGGYFADWVMETTPDYLARDTTEDVIIETTLDQDMQKKAEEALAWVFENKVKAGSKGPGRDRGDERGWRRAGDGRWRNMPNAGDFNRATQALRQTGSTFKPFIYAVAMDLGYSPLDLCR